MVTRHPPGNLTKAPFTVFPVTPQINGHRLVVLVTIYIRVHCICFLTPVQYDHSASYNIPLVC